MTDPQSKHITGIIDDVTSDLYEKYQLGTVEHQGLLSDMPAQELLTNLKEEILDANNYIYSLIPKLQRYFNDPLIQQRMQEIDRLEGLVASRNPGHITDGAARAAGLE